MMTPENHCERCGGPLDVPANSSRRCPRCGTPHVRADLSPRKFPVAMKLVSGKTDEVLWSRVITLDEAEAQAKIEIPSYANTEHCPVRAEIEYADGTIDVGGMQ